MKKRLIAWVLAGIAALSVLTGCVMSEPLNCWQGLSMYAAADSVTPAGLRLSKINDSEELIFGYGVPFRIEEYSGGFWRQVPFMGDVEWRLPLLTLSPGSAAEEDIGWERMHGILPPGRYRVVRSFIQFDPYDRTPMWERDIPEAYLYAAFAVEEYLSAEYHFGNNQ